MERPRLIVAALRGGSGKTILSVGIIAAWRKLGKNIAPFKKGPDYIDAGWLALASGKPCYNLDTFLVSKSRVFESFLSHSEKSDCAVIEGNRGFFDGTDLDGSTSTAELAKLLSAPVVLCIDCTKTTRTMAAVVLGCMRFDPEVEIRGVILNRVAGARHEDILRKSIERYCGIPVLGAVPKLNRQRFPERHMGLVPTPEYDSAAIAVSEISQIAETYLDLNALYDIAQSSCQLSHSMPSSEQSVNHVSESHKQHGIIKAEDRPKIGIIKDSAFQFYYPENIQALISAGAEPVYISPLESRSLPAIDALYIGGGFPETHAEALAENHGFTSELKALAEDGLPIYAECGGLMYLAKDLILNDTAYPMVDVLPIVFGLSKKPQGHGYTIIRIDKENPYFNVGTEFRGHEFHYSRILHWWGSEDDLVFSMVRGTGLIKQRDGIVYKNVLATYTHLHALGVPFWAEVVVRNAIAQMKNRYTQ